MYYEANGPPVAVCTASVRVYGASLNFLNPIHVIQLERRRINSGACSSLVIDATHADEEVREWPYIC